MFGHEKLYARMSTVSKQGCDEMPCLRFFRHLDLGAYILTHLPASNSACATHVDCVTQHTAEDTEFIQHDCHRLVSDLQNLVKCLDHRGLY